MVLLLFLRVEEEADRERDQKDARDDTDKNRRSMDPPIACGDIFRVVVFFLAIMSNHLGRDKNQKDAEQPHRDADEGLTDEEQVQHIDEERVAEQDERVRIPLRGEINREIDEAIDGDVPPEGIVLHAFLERTVHGRPQKIRKDRKEEEEQAANGIEPHNVGEHIQHDDVYFHWE